MHRILSANPSLPQHIEQIAHAPEVYRPFACPHCGVAGLWLHGFYERKPDRDGPAGASLNPVLVVRFCCGVCGRTCSRLPLSIAPRRWHPWAKQQRVLLDLLAGASLRCAAPCAGVARHTARRWRDWLHAGTSTFAFVLRSRFPELGRGGAGADFWTACLAAMPLAEAMAWADREISVP
jgi:transposase-like protein